MLESELCNQGKDMGVLFKYLALKQEEPFHHPEKCLFYSGKWRNVCLACGKVEMEDGWRKL